MDLPPHPPMSAPPPGTRRLHERSHPRRLHGLGRAAQQGPHGVWHVYRRRLPHRDLRRARKTSSQPGVDVRFNFTWDPRTS